MMSETRHQDHRLLRSVFPLLFGIVCGTCIAGLGTPGVRADVVPMAVYRVPLGAELEEIQRSIRQLENQCQQLLLLKQMVETRDWAGLGRLIGDPRLTGLIDQLQVAVRSTKRIAEDFAALNPGIDPAKTVSASDYARQMAQRLETARRARTALLQIMNERYADCVVDGHGNVSEYRRSNSIPAYIQYAGDVNRRLGEELARLNGSAEASLVKSIQLNSQIQLATNAAILQILQGISDQNRMLSLMASPSGP